MLLVGKSVILPLIHEIQLFLKTIAESATRFPRHLRLDWVLGALDVHFVDLRCEPHLFMILLKFDLIARAVRSSMLSRGLRVELVPLVAGVEAIL